MADSRNPNNDDAPETATVALIDAKVDGLKDFIGLGFENIGRRLDDLAGLEPRIRELENEAVRRVGPIIDEIRRLEGDVVELSAKVEALDRSAVTSEQVKTALRFDADQRAVERSSAFGHREKIIGGLFLLFNFALNAAQFVLR